MKESARPILIFGKQGQVARALSQALTKSGTPFHSIGQKDCDLTKTTDKVPHLIQEANPRAIILASAFTQVDLAEDQPDLAMALNAIAPRVIAEACENLGIPFLLYSTDYVFSGEGKTPWTESDEPKPKSVYGKTKRQGELEVLKTGARAWILRTSWVYDEQGKNFPNTIRKLANEKDELKIVDDQIGAPTYALDLAETSVEILEKAFHEPELPYGIFHTTNAGQISWYGFALRILAMMEEREEAIRAKILPIPSSEYPTRAPRPLNSRLDPEKLNSLLGLKLPHWEDAFHRCSLLWQ